MLPKHNMNIGQHLVWHLTYECRHTISSIDNLDHKSSPVGFYETYIMVEYKVFHTPYHLLDTKRPLENSENQ